MSTGRGGWLQQMMVGHPQDIARACVFLARNDYATGAIVRVDGGEGLARRET